MKRIREFFESIAFAGLKPSGGAAAPGKQLKWLGPLQDRVERYLSGGPTPNDPLYLTNRTTSQKLRAWSLIAVPCFVLLVGIGLTLYFLEPREPKLVTPPSKAEINTKLLPSVDKEFKLAPPSDLQVIEVGVENGHVTGVVQNTSNREIASAELVIELTNAMGSQVGAVNTTVEKIPASGRREFALNVKQHDAAYALVREITPR